MADYAYFSSYSDSWLQHAKSYVSRVIERFGLGANSKVVEIASNDGYLLQYFVEADVPVLGIEPAQNVAAVARAKGIPTRVEFFGERAARTSATRGAARRSADRKQCPGARAELERFRQRNELASRRRRVSSRWSSPI